MSNAFRASGQQISAATRFELCCPSLYFSPVRCRGEQLRTSDNTETDNKYANTIPHQYLVPTLRVLVTLCHAVPLVGMIVAFLFFPWWQPSWLTIGLMIVIWYCSLCIGITVGYHRLFSHRAFQAPSWMRALIAICGSMAGQGPVDCLGGTPSLPSST